MFGVGNEFWIKPQRSQLIPTARKTFKVCVTKSKISSNDKLKCFRFYASTIVTMPKIKANELNLIINSSPFSSIDTKRVDFVHPIHSQCYVVRTVQYIVHYCTVLYVQQQKSTKRGVPINSMDHTTNYCKV